MVRAIFITWRVGCCGGGGGQWPLGGLFKVLAGGGGRRGGVAGGGVVRAFVGDRGRRRGAGGGVVVCFEGRIKGRCWNGGRSGWGVGGIIRKSSRPVSSMGAGGIEMR